MAISHDVEPHDAVPSGFPYPVPTPLAPPRRAAVPRAHLVQRIEQGTAGKLTTILAPAGWGKTSLLAEWMATTGQPYAWLPLGPRDNSLARGLRQIATAIWHVLPAATTDLLGRLRSPYPPDIDETIAFLADVLDDPDAAFVFVIDDVHHLTDPDLIEVLRQLVHTSPPAVRFILASRRELPLQVGRLRVQGEVTELRIDELRFGLEEASSLFAQHPAVGSDWIETILANTEGWAAGLQIAALTLRNGQGEVDSIARIRGTQREVAGYLCEEVFSGLDPEMQAFLLDAGVFEKISAVFLDAARERSDSQRFLQQAVDANLFVTPLNCPQQKFRIHQLFRDYLQAELARRDPGRAALLHRRAAHWLLDQGDVIHAVNHLFTAGELDEAVDLVDRVCGELVVTSEHISSFLRWVEMFPRDRVLGKPCLLRSYVQALTVTGRLADAEAVVNDIVSHPYYQDEPGVPENDHRQAEKLAVQSRIAAYRGESERTIALATEALRRLGSGELAWRASLHLDLGWTYRGLGDIDAAATNFLQASRLGWQAGSLQPALLGTRYLALSWMTQGRIREAMAQVEADIERARGLGTIAEPAMAALIITRGELLHAQYRTAEARANLEQGIALAQRTGDAKILMNGFVALALLEQAEGRMDSAMLMLRRGTRIFDGDQEAAIAACMALEAGQRGAAERWAAQSGLSADDDFLPQRAPAEQGTYALVLAATGEIGAAIRLLERVAAGATAHGWHGHAVRLRVHLALLLAQDGERDRALEELVLAIERAAPEGYARDFVEAGPEMTPLLRDLMRSRLDFDREFVTGLLARQEARHGDAQAADPLVESLTERQRDVLRLMADGLPNRAIADALYLAEGTVKAHVHQITGKLLARNRTEAVARARDLGLLA